MKNSLSALLGLKGKSRGLMNKTERGFIPKYASGLDTGNNYPFNLHPEK